MPLSPRWSFLAGLVLANAASAQEVFINEIHYDNDGADSGEFVEIAGPAGRSLGGLSLVFYNGNNGQPYKGVELSGTLPDEGSGFGALAFFVAGIQNGAPDGTALLEGGTTIEFLSYEGSFTVDGLAAQEIGVAETPTTPIGQSLQRSGSGREGRDFSWVGPAPASPGTLNVGQELTRGANSISLSLSHERIGEAAGPGAVIGSIQIHPPPQGRVSIQLAAERGAGAVVLPPSITIESSGRASFDIDILGDLADDRAVGIVGSDPSGTYRAVRASLLLLDLDPPALRGAAIRVACFNLREGAGARGSREYGAAVRVLRRIDADVIAFSEANPDFDFATLKALLEDIGMSSTEEHLATAGEGFVGTIFDEGEFGSGLAVAVASRFPITRAVQIGRGAPGRRELTRYPLFVQVDVPDAARDPSFVAVHLKAGGTRADIFRRAVEGHRIREFLEAEGVDGARDNVFVLGDVNEDFEDNLPNSVATGIDPATHIFPDGSTLPPSYLLGEDLLPPGAQIPYRGFPATAFAALDVRILDARAPDGESRTYNVAGDARLDYILAAGATVANAHPQVEVYNSLLECVSSGLPKRGAAPFGADSRTASDHYALFGDFALERVPQIHLELVPDRLDESAPAPVVARLSVDPAPAVDFDIRLESSSERLRVPGAVRIPAGHGPLEIPVALAEPPLIERDGEFRLSAHAPGHATGHAYIDVRGGRASGALLFSDYVEPPSGGSPKAVEVVNAGGVAIDFSETPLHLVFAPNGSDVGDSALVVRDGRLPPGAVFVIGDVSTGDYLVSEGLLANPGQNFSSFAEGAVFLEGGSQRLVFVKQQLFFNGDDALALRLSGVLADTFGSVGSDPGAAWEGGGVSTANVHLALRDSIGTGSAGWDDPSERWSAAGPGTDLAGVGIAPGLEDPYLFWARGRGLLGATAAPVADPDRDGFSNLLEYALGGEELRLREGAAGLVLEHGRRVSHGNLDYAIEAATDLGEWQLLSLGVPVQIELVGDDLERVGWSLPAEPPLTNAAYRLRVRLP